ncbi:MAG: hypothetical protein QME94_09445, partial [Anaerolineae bacterium]|nr:hypothetical protein [Anaerolineae bacterium]
DEPVYEPYLLLRTLLALEGREILRTPADTGDLVAAVYDEPEPDVNDRPGLHAALRAAEERMAAATRNALDEARSRLLQGPDSRYFVGGQPETLQEDDPSLHRSLQALTRLADPSVQVVCLHRRDDGLYTDPEGGAPVQYDRLDDETARRLAQSSVSVTHRGVVFGLLAEPPPAAWARHPFLRHCRLAIFVDGICPVPGGPYTLSLTRELGLQVIKEVR